MEYVYCGVWEIKKNKVRTISLRTYIEDPKQPIKFLSQQAVWKTKLWRILLATAFIVLWVVSVAPPVFTGAVGIASASEGAPFTKEQFEELSKLISETPLEKLDLDFFKKVYQTDHAPDILKLLFGKPINPFPEKNRRLGNLRKWYDWYIQAEYARDNYVIIENTNQGKDNGARSDLDATANILEFDKATGKLRIRDKAVADLIKWQAESYGKDRLNPDGVDVTLFNGDVWLPDWRDSRMSYEEFTRKLLSNTWDLKNRKGAYFVPGAHKEQPHDRGLAEGHSIHIGWDYIKKVPTINGHPVEFDYQKGEIVDIETKEPIQEYNTREMAKKGVVPRYEGMDVLLEQDKWRRSLGNVAQNTREFLSHDEPISRNKYFIERIIDQAAGRIVNWEELSFVENLGALTQLSQNSYVEMHGSDLDETQKNAWKKAFIQQAFGIPESEDEKIREIQSVLDRSSEIQLDKTKKWHDKHGADYLKRRQDYYKEELKEAEENVKKQLEATGKQPGADFEELKLKEAERIFVEKQRNIMIEGGVRVVEESFWRDFTPEGIRRWNRSNFDSLTKKKIMFERGVELALLLDIIETAPRMSRPERDALRQRVINTIPESAKPLVAKLAEISGLKMLLVGRVGFERWTKTADRLSDIRPTELIAQIEEEMKRLLGEKVDSKPPSVPDDAVRKAIFETVYDHLGPMEREQFQKDWEAGKRALIAKFGASAYWNEIKNQMDFLMTTGAVLGMVNAYQQHCVGETTILNEDCLSGLAWEAGNQTLYILPGINTGFLILSGVKAVNEGNPEGFITLGLGTASLPSVANALGIGGAVGIQLYIAYQIVKTGYAVTVGYAEQTMENDAVEQAFKALPEPGNDQARRYNYPNQPTIFKAESLPTMPLLSDVIKAEADQWDAGKRYRVAKEMFAPSIQKELKDLGLKPYTDEWYNKRYEIIQRYADALPYTQRTEKIYKVFHPKVEQLVKYIRSQGRPDVGENEYGMNACLEVREAKVEAKYKASPSLWNRLRFWRDDQKDKQKELNQVWSECIQEMAKEDLETLSPVFGKYLNEWFSQQNPGYRASYNTPDFRAKLVNALINEYVVRRHLDLGYESERQMKRAAQAAQELAETRIKLMGNLLKAQEDTKDEVQTELERAAERTYQGDPPEELAAKPEIKLKTPSYAVRFGEEAPIDFLARGMYYSENRPDGTEKNKWKASIQSEILKVALGQPANMVMTQELEDELKVEPGKQPMRFIKVDEKLTGELKNGLGNKLASAETTVNYYGLLPRWNGSITVEVRAADPETKDLSNPRRGYPYERAMVKLSGPTQSQKESEYRYGDYSSADFSNLPAGNFSIHVDPEPGDKLHSPVDAKVSLSDYSVVWPNEISEKDKDGSIFTIKRLDKDENGNPLEKEMALVKWKDQDTITVVLPYVQPPKEITEDVPPSVAQTQVVPEPTHTDEKPTEKVPPSIAQTQVVPESTPIPTKEEETTGNVPPSVAQTQVVPVPTPISTKEEATGNVPPSIAQTQVVPVLTPVPTEGETTGNVPPSMAETGNGTNRPPSNVTSQSRELNGECTGNITVSTTSGYEDDSLAVTITILPPFDQVITRITINDPQWNGVIPQTGLGIFTHPGKFKGKGKFRIEFDAFDKDGKLRCYGFTPEMMSLGPRP